MKSERKSLVVIIADHLSALLKKGELIERYYNPGNFFEEVHIVMTNEDRVAGEDIRRCAGDGSLYLHNLPSPSFMKTGGWQIFLIRDWIERGTRLIGKISPSLIRVYNNFLEGYLASEIKARLGIPYVISLHGVWDRDCLGTFNERFRRLFRVKFERRSLEGSDSVIAVYRPIIRYARKYGARDVHLIYNAVAGDKIVHKENYGLSKPPKLITVNRQVREKNPENIIRAIGDLDCHYTIVGDGDYHTHLVAVAKEAGIREKVEFIPSLSNDRLCSLLQEFDLFLSHCDYYGISKTIIEAAIAGLPIILNKNPVEEDFEGDWLLRCENTSSGYRDAIARLIDSEESRIAYGKRAHAHAMENFDPAAMEKKVVQLYKNILNAKGVEESAKDLQ